MAGFAADHFTLIVFAVFVCVFAGMLARVLRRAKRIDREGTETDAVVSRVEFDRVPDGSDSYLVYVRYTDDKGTRRESKAGMFITAEYEEGQQVRIRFIPGEYDMVRIMKNL